jgi:hypothetical protein
VFFKLNSLLYSNRFVKVKGLKFEKLGAIGLIVLIPAPILLDRIIASAPAETTLKPYNALAIIDVDPSGDIE